jgi:hypothetical protein
MVGATREFTENQYRAPLKHTATPSFNGNVAVSDQKISKFFVLRGNVQAGHVGVMQFIKS